MFPTLLLWTSGKMEFSAIDVGKAMDETGLAGFRRIEDKLSFGCVEFSVHIRYPSGNSESGLEETAGLEIEI